MPNNTITKARYWWAVMYPENMVDNWENDIADLVQVPFAYCVHNQDTDSKSEHRKDHMHLILAFKNTTTYAHAMSIFSLLGKSAVNTCKAVIDIHHAYDYLIHDTSSCKKAGKHVYDKSCRVLGNNFDIGMYEVLSQDEKYSMLKELIDFIKDNQLYNMAHFMETYEKVFDSSQYFPIIAAHNAFIDRVLRGNYQRYFTITTSTTSTQSTCETSTDLHEKNCIFCGSRNIAKRGKTASNLQRYKCNDCGKSWI